MSIPLSLYIHIPWCVQKCPYCDFNSHAVKSMLPESEYITKVLQDLRTDKERFNENRPLTSIFIGGGTPSLFSGESIGRLLDGVAEQFQFTDNIEITLEANPGTKPTQAHSMKIISKIIIAVGLTDCLSVCRVFIMNN